MNGIQNGAVNDSSRNGARNVVATGTSSGGDVITTMNGAPIKNIAASQRIGNQLRGTMLLQDINLLEVIQHLTHERIPERLVHARGTGAHGYFEVTDSISDVTSADFLQRVGEKTPLFVRFSTDVGERGSAETVRDVRGFAFKMKTKEGILDWVFLSTPAFPMRDGAKFPSFTHALKRNPQSGLPDHTMFWDYFNNNQEAIHFVMFLFSDRHTPIDFQHADCFGVNTYRFTKPTSQGVKNFTAREAQAVAGSDPDYQTRSLFDDLEAGKTPSWDVYAQIIDPKKAANYPIDIFDPTKTLPHEDFPLRKFGRIVLNKNPDDNFAEVEQSAFSPTNIVPGWALSPDPVLQTRALAYADTQRHRLGVNFIQLPINKPEYSFNPLTRDGAATFKGLGATPNYFPSSFSRYGVATQYAQPDEEHWLGTAVNYDAEVVDADFEQPRIFWEKVLAGQPGQPGQQDNFVSNVSGHLKGAVEEVRKVTYAMFTRVNTDLGKRIQTATEAAVVAVAAGTAPPKTGIASQFADMKLADLYVKKQAPHDSPHNFDLFAHKTWNLS
ncbi:hypothetical protein CHU98_g9958 [Xylaria longipes]|nr:hypothetical protein CHU98_g9958 [Xylaria longipes]